MTHIQSKIKAVIEVLFVFFIVFFLMGVLFASPLGEWERNLLQRLSDKVCKPELMELS